MPKTGLEPAHLATHAPETCASTNSATWASSALQFLVCSINGAENGTRTRDPNLGKVVLYQLSYFRIFYLFLTLFRALLNKHFSKCDAKVRLFSETTKLFTFFFYTKYYFYTAVDINQSYLQFSTNETKFLVNCHSLDNIDIFNTQGEIPRNPHTPLASSYGNKQKAHRIERWAYIILRCKY